MPGPVSDSYDPEFSTAANAADVREAILGVRQHITNNLGTELKNIVEVAQSKGIGQALISFSKRDLRLIRFAIDRAVESI